MFQTWLSLPSGQSHASLMAALRGGCHFGALLKRRPESSARSCDLITSLEVSHQTRASVLPDPKGHVLIVSRVAVLYKVVGRSAVRLE